MGRLFLAVAVLLGAAACGRHGFDSVAGDGSPDPVDASSGAGDGPAGDGSGGGADGALPGEDGPPPAQDGALADYSGTFQLSDAISYTCASGLVDVGVTAFTFDDGATLSVVSDDTGSPPQPCEMTGEPVGVAGGFDVTCTIPGTCNEIYRLQGTFNDPDGFAATFTIEFSGMFCLNCADQSFPAQGSR